jgi:hypothetical protein
MSQTQHFAGGQGSGEPDPWPDEPVEWTAETPDWSLPPARVHRAAPVQPAGRRRRALLLAVVAIAGVLVGAVATAVLVTAAFVSAADDIGRGMSAGLGSDIGRSVGEGIARSMHDSLGGTRAAGTAAAAPSAAVQQFPAVAPGRLGADPVLDGHAQSCFGGDLSACDRLRAESAPLSGYQTYGATCGGRVKPGAVATCTDLH